jgi:hypothetical protein
MDDKLALVTGASNRGYDVVITSAGERLSRVAEEIGRRGHRVIEVNADWPPGTGPTDSGNSSIAWSSGRRCMYQCRCGIGWSLQ